VAGWWFSPGTPVSSTNKTDCHDISKIVLTVALNTIALTLYCTYNKYKTLMIPNIFSKMTGVQVKTGV
jgi:hypothetical protein